MRGPLHGLPLAVKDIIDTADQPTAYGSKAYAGNRPAQDAACVALARAAGAAVLGKTVTTEFALRAPGPTANPHAPAHTPGGSSSGSAAAVADCMVPVAFGTQTGGSVIRPASYCGVVGYKPSLGTINRTGVKPLAESFDTVGLFARSVEDVALVTAVLAGDAPARYRIEPVRPDRIGLCRTPSWSEAEDASRAALEAAAASLARAGLRVEEVDAAGGLRPVQRLAVDRAALRGVPHLRLRAHGARGPARAGHARGARGRQPDRALRLPRGQGRHPSLSRPDRRGVPERSICCWRRARRARRRGAWRAPAKRPSTGSGPAF